MKLRFVWLALPVLLGGCKDDPEPVPAYIRLEPFVVNENGGAGWQKITEGWLYVDNQLIGGYTLPATVPVLAEGESPILVFPGVKANGLKDSPEVYPFMVRYETSVNLAANQNTTIQPVTKYSADAKFPWSADKSSFNNTSVVLENRDQDTANTFVLTTDGAFDGQSVKLAVDTAHALMEIVTEQLTGLPASNAQPVWLEMNYKNDLPFELWLLGARDNTNELARAVYQFNTSNEWNKIYINLTDYLISLQQDKYRLYFRVLLTKDATGKYVQNNGTVLFDNLRLVHF